MVFTFLTGGEGGTPVQQEEDEEDERDIGNNKSNVMNTCLDITTNGTIVTQTCTKTRISGTEQCDSLFTPLNFWGVSIVVFANMIYIFPYLIVVIFCLVVPDVRRRAYDKAVLCYNACQFTVAVILLVMGYFVLCHKPMMSMCYVFLGLTLMFLTIASVFWMFIICFDMTLVITRIRWVPSTDGKEKGESRKFTMYSICVWGGAFVPTAFTCLVELLPMIPKNSPIKPNFERFDDGANLSVIIHVMTIPLIACVINNILFVYTTYKIIQIRRSTAIANENRLKSAKKKYFVLLRLYLLMDAPWLIGILAATFPDLWVLKFCRMVQPILMLLAILPTTTYSRAMRCFERSKSTDDEKCVDKNGTIIPC